jgi:hypothetical protein
MMPAMPPETITIAVRLPVALVARIDEASIGNRAQFLRRSILSELNRTTDIERFAHLSKQILLLTDKIDDISKVIKGGEK